MDRDFVADADGLHRAIDLLLAAGPLTLAAGLPDSLPETGIGSGSALANLAPIVIGGAARLGEATSFAHMDPPTPWVTWAATLWSASLNQNLLHPATAPAAREIEERVVRWLSPFFGMSGGHMTPGSTVANLTALWAARECVGVDTVMASDSAHLSVEKAAHILGLAFQRLPTDREGALQAGAVPSDLSRTALVLTAGTTSTGAIDPLDLAGRAAWTHVDAAWAGPLRLSRHADRLDGIEKADSVAISAHKWLFQPKESAFVLFRDAPRASASISFGGAYLTTANIGILGSHGAAAVPLLATLMAWGRTGLADRIERCVDLADTLASFVQQQPGLRLLAKPRTGIVVWRPDDEATFETVHRSLPSGMASTTSLAGLRWFRHVAANPNADFAQLSDALRRAIA
jgi:L-2,4-diaminobutyrate decarboxylase